ncbi:fibronectin type III domain-containing protein, partial [Paenibacillus popilliae]
TGSTPTPQIPPVTNFRVIELWNGHINFEFDPVPGASHYYLKRNGSNIGNSYETTVIHQGSMVEGLTYRYEVGAVVNGIQGPTGSITITAPPVKESPTNLTATATSNTEATLKWDAMPGADEYVVKRRNSSFVTKVTTNSFTDTGLIAGSSYGYYVHAVYNGVWSAPSAVSVKLDTGSTPTPQIPPVTNFRVIELWNGHINFEFDPVPGASHYYLKRNGSNIGNSYETTVIHQGSMVEGLTYRYEVGAVVNGIQGPTGSITITAPPVKESPTNLTATATSNTEATLKWDAMPGADEYVVKRRNSSFVTKVTTNSFTDTGLIAGSSYGYYVHAVY